MSAAPLLVAAIVPGIVLVASGCGGGSKASRVATLATTSPGGEAGTTTTARPSFAAFAQCMNEHGVETTSPGGHGVLIQGAAPAQTQAAMAACRSLMPGGGPPQLSPAQRALRARELAVLAACMRKHGVANFPDPNGEGQLPFGALDTLDPSSPVFKAAYEACWSLFPKVGPQLRLTP